MYEFLSHRTEVWGYLVYCVFYLFVRLRISQRRKLERDRGVTFCMRVRLLSGHKVSPFGERWLAGSHGGGITSVMNGSAGSCVSEHGMRIRNWGGGIT